jgi:hypothetical protein
MYMPSETQRSLARNLGVARIAWSARERHPRIASDDLVLSDTAPPLPAWLRWLVPAIPLAFLAA